MMTEKNAFLLEKIDETRWRIPRHGPMNADGIIYASAPMLPKIKSDQSPVQVANVACLPGIVGNALAMPDIHWGYGFPIGGVAAFDMDNGIISPGGVGYDINCGVRLFRTGLRKTDIEKNIRALVEGLFANIPSGLGSKRTDFKLTGKDYQSVLQKGAAWAVEKGFGTANELDHIEDRGSIPGADPTVISDRAFAGADTWATSSLLARIDCFPPPAGESPWSYEICVYVVPARVNN